MMMFLFFAVVSCFMIKQMFYKTYRPGALVFSVTDEKANDAM